MSDVRPEDYVIDLDEGWVEPLKESDIARSLPPAVRRKVVAAGETRKTVRTEQRREAGRSGHPGPGREAVFVPVPIPNPPRGGRGPAGFGLWEFVSSAASLAVSVFSLALVLGFFYALLGLAAGRDLPGSEAVWSLYGKLWDFILWLFKLFK
jgi:hypothetical protein